MATISYKGFTLNVPGRKPPWGDDEYQFHKDIIDTTVKDCYSAEMDTTSGHRHYRVYDTGSNVILRGVSQGSMRLEYNESRYLKIDVDSYGVTTLTPVAQAGYEIIKIPSDNTFMIGSGTLKESASTEVLTISGYNGLILTASTGAITLGKDTTANGSIQLKDRKELILGDDGDAKILSPLATSNQTHIDLTGNANSRGLLISLPSAESGTGVATLRLSGAPRYCAIRKTASATEIDSGDELGRMQFMGGAVSDPYWEYGAWVAGYAADDWSSGAYPSELRIYVTNSGASTAVNSATFTADEKLSLKNSTYPASATIYASQYNMLCLNSNDVRVDASGHLAIKLYSQTTQPTLTYDNFFCFWKNTGDSNKIYLVFRRSSGDHVKVQLT